MKCLRKYKWLKLHRACLPTGRGIMGYWAKLASRAAFRKGYGMYCGFRNPVEPGMWAGGIVGLKSILAMMENRACIDFLRKEIQKKPDNIGFLKGVGSIIAADIAADSMHKKLEVFLEDNEVYDQTELESLIKLTGVIAGKFSPRIAQLWHWIAQRMEQFAQIVPEKNVRNCDFSVAEHLQKTFLQTILWNSQPEMIELAKSLAAENREWFLCCGFLADMAELSAVRLYERYAPMIIRNGILKRESKAERSDRIQIMRGLSAIRWSAQLHSYYVAFTRFDGEAG